MRRPKVFRPIGPIGPTIGCIARIQGHSYSALAVVTAERCIIGC